MFKKILIGIGVIIVLMIGAVISVVLLVTFTNKPKAAKEIIMKSNTNSAKKALIIYQPSISKTPSVMATAIAKGLNDGGYEATLNYPGEKLSTDISKYSLIIFGSPTYAGKPLSIVTDYMKKVKDFSSKKVVLFSTGADANNKGELDELEKSMAGNKAYKKIKFTGDKKESEKKAYDLGKELSKE